MHELSNNPGSFGYSETSGEIGNFATPSARKEYFQSLIAKANLIPLIDIIRFYGIKIYSENTLICPFTSHKSGKELSGSFKFYEETNSFYCFGCKKGGIGSHACEFVALMDNINSFQAAKKIIKVFKNNINFNSIPIIEQYYDNLEIMVNFSNIVREFRKKHNDQESLIFIEKRCEVFDNICIKHQMSAEALNAVIENITEQIKIYEKS